MAKLLRVSEAASLALHACGLLAPLEGQAKTTRELAGALQSSEAHLAKVLARLDRAGLVTSRRGPGGGYQLAKPPERISLRQVCEVIEGEYETSECPFGLSICDGEGLLARQFQSVTKQLLKFMEKTTLATWRIRLTDKGPVCKHRSHTCGESHGEKGHEARK